MAVGDIPALVGVQCDPDSWADGVARDREPAKIVSKVGADL